MNSFIKSINLLVIGVAVLCSCSSFLDEHPTTSLSETSVYESEAALEAQITGCYNGLHSSSLWKGTMAEYFHPGSALLIWKGLRTTDDNLESLKFTHYSTSSYGNKNIWNATWTGINRCNRLMDNLPDSPVEENYKKEIEAEARFIRAIEYFLAVRIWGDVPIIKNSPSDASEVNSARQTWYKVYAFILDDIAFAEQNMRDRDRQEELNFEKNRPYRMAATALKATVYLHIGSLLAHPDDNFWDSSKDASLIAEGKDPRSPDFSSCGINSAEDAFRKAREAAKTVIEDPLTPYRLCNDYRQLYRWTEHEDWFLPEGIFVLTSSNKVGTNYNSVRMLPAFPEGTLNVNTTNGNWGRARPSRFAIDNFIKYSGAQPYDGTEAGAKIAADGLYIDTTDPRFMATFLFYYKNLNKNSMVKTYPYQGNYVESTAAEYCLPFFRKYSDPTYDVSNGNASFYLIRLAEMYLTVAEADANLSQGSGDEYWTEAVDMVNVLRTRARKSNDNGVDDGGLPLAWETSTFSSKQDLINGIFWERFIEMSGEGHEWFDTHRMGAAWLSSNIAVPANDFYIDNVNQNYYSFYFFPSAETEGYIYPEDPGLLRKSLLIPYPETELRLNTSIQEQNDFYWQ